MPWDNAQIAILLGKLDTVIEQLTQLSLAMVKNKAAPSLPVKKKLGRPKGSKNVKRISQRKYRANQSL